MAVAFQQQGSLDWTSLAASGGTLSLQLLQRISAAGIDPYTALVGQAVCGSLRCGSGGRTRFLQALESCKGLAGYRNALWFGFGVRHIATALVASEQGTTCAAICSCLVECYSTHFAAEILMEMTKASTDSSETIPSLLQWHNLVKSCAGLVTKSTFGIKAEQMMRLVGEFRIASPLRRCTTGDFVGDRGVAHQRNIAQTLLGLGKLSNGLLHQMTIIGGADAGFIAAIADWLLDLDVEIRGLEDVDAGLEETVFRSKNGHPDRQPQLVVIYEKDAAADSVHCVGQTYRLPDARQVIRRENGSAQETVLSGRVLWEKAFEYTFNRDFKRLMELELDFGKALGCAARVYQGLFEADGRLPPEWRRDCRSYFPDSYGPAYVHFILTRFPEFEPLRNHMWSAERSQTALQASSSFEAHMQVIATECGCLDCCPVEGERPSRAPINPNDRIFCLVYLVYTIIKTTRVLSGIVTELCPMRSGLEAMFWQFPRMSISGISALKVMNILDSDRDWHNGKGTKILLQTADTIFGGDRIQQFEVYRDWICAIAENGLCSYFDVLIEPSFGARRAARIHVTPGHIEYRDRAYKMIRDAGSEHPPLAGPTDQGQRGWRSVMDLLENGSDGQAELLVEERLDGLSVCYGISRDSTIHHTFGPARAVHMMCRNEGLVPACYGKCTYSSQLEKMREDLRSSLSSGSSLCRFKDDESQVEFLFIMGDVLACLAAAAGTWDPIIQRIECLACCIRYALTTERKYVTIIMGMHYVEAMKRNIKTLPESD